MPIANPSDAAGAPPARESGTSDEPTFLIRKLGSNGIPTYLERAQTEHGEHRFVVVERLSRGTMTTDEAAECVREGRVAAALEHPNVVRTRAVTVRRDELSITSDYVAGERLSELWSSGSASTAMLPLEIGLRILVDVSAGLGALHKLRGAEGHERVKFVHGEVTDENVLVGLDGVSLVLRASRVRGRSAPPRTDGGTLAPEVLSGGAADQRADVYSLGALLWRALSGRWPLPGGETSDVAAGAERDQIAQTIVTKHGRWALPLADVAARALAPAPDKRFPTVSSMVTELRRIAGSKLATADAVARFVESAAGGKIAARLADVQASAVIRKATSIPAPRPTPVPMPVAAIAPVPHSPTEPIAEQLIEVPQPPSEPQLPPAPSALPIAPSSAAASSPAPLTPPKPISPPRTPKTPERAAAARPSRVVTKASAVASKRELTPSPQAAWLPRWAIGALLALLLLTGGLALRAVHNRQAIVTPGAIPVDNSTIIPPLPSALPEKLATPAKGPSVVPRAETNPAPRSTSLQRPTKPAAPREAPAPTLKAK